MSQITEQMNEWSSDFGKEYTDRNHVPPEKMDDFYRNLYGIEKRKMNLDFLKGLSINNILEIGCNVGDQLAFLQSMKYTNLYGIELQQYAVNKSSSLYKGLNIVQGSGFDIPFKNEYFDLVYTHGVLIHISPDDLPKIMNEIYRCTKKYIWGLEYYATEHQDLNYRGNKNLMWKGDFAGLFLKQFSSLKLIKQKIYPYTDGAGEDAMYLLEKI